MPLLSKTDLINVSTSIAPMFQGFGMNLFGWKAEEFSNEIRYENLLKLDCAFRINNEIGI
jgi:hypothetical protein